MANKKTLFKVNKDDLSYEEPIEEVCFTDYVEPTGNFITLFSVEDNTTNKDKSESVPKDNKPLPSDNTIIDARIGKPTVNGITPPINGEYFNVNRGYTLRKSTVVMLINLKPLILISTYIWIQ